MLNSAKLWTLKFYYWSKFYLQSTFYQKIHNKDFNIDPSCS